MSHPEQDLQKERIKVKKAITVLLVLVLMITTAFSVCAEEKKLTFNTTDLNGNRVDESILRGHSVILFNIWEPWCGPCVGEMPILESLYQKYKDRGLLIIGVVNGSPSGMDPWDTIRETGVTYPVINSCDAFNRFMPGYIPASFFVDAGGNLIDVKNVFMGSALNEARTEAASYAVGDYDQYLNDPGYAEYQTLFTLLKQAVEGGETELMALAEYYVEDRFFGQYVFYGSLDEMNWDYLIGSLCY